MATFNKFQQFAEDLAKGVHQFQAAGHTLNVYLSNATPDAALDGVKADLAEITNQNGYTAPVDIQNDYTETAGVGTLTGVDVTITATGAVGPFRYVVLYNDTPTSPADPLIGWWDYGSSISLANSETFLINFGASILTVQ
jgi:hypothetical protein